MTRISLFFLCLFSIVTLIAPASPAVAASPVPAQVVERLHDGLLTAMKQGAKLGFDGRAKLLKPVVQDCFDLGTMARVATGATWAKLSDADRTRITETFADFTVANYASQFKSFDGDKFVTTDTIDMGRVQRVSTQLVPSGEEPVDLVYQLRPDKGGALKIVDVLVDGSISQLALRRNEFAAALAQGGVGNLVGRMEKSIAGMKTN